jgi:hypothetical protein
VTWPSPAMTTLPPLRTVKIVVPCQVSDEEGEDPMVLTDIGRAGRFVKLGRVNALIALYDLLAYKRALGSELLTAVS